MGPARPTQLTSSSVSSSRAAPTHLSPSRYSVNKLTALVVAAALAVLPSCSWFHHEEAVAKQAAIDCASQDQALAQVVLDTGVSLLMLVTTTIFEGDAQWKDTLDALANKYGHDAVHCAVYVAEALFNDAKSHMGITTSSAAATPHDRAASYVAGESFK